MERPEPTGRSATDIAGHPLAVGDRVAFSTISHGNPVIRLATVAAVSPERVNILRDERGSPRHTSMWRLPRDLVLVRGAGP